MAKWSRRHKPLVGSTAVALVLAVVGLATGMVLLAQKQAEIERQRDEAHRQRQHARQAVDRMYTRVAEDWIARQPQLEPLQREFLLEALRFYQSFSEEEAKEPAELEGKALAYRRVGSIQQSMEQNALAQEAYVHALELFEDLVNRFSMVSEYRSDLAKTYHKQGEVFLKMGRLVESERAYIRALTIREALWKEYPTVLDFGAEFGAESQRLRNTLPRPRTISRRRTII